MTIKDTFTPMADHLRSEYGVDGLLTTEQLKTGINGLHVQNLLDEGQSYDSAVGSGWKDLTGLRNHFSLLPGKTITISFDTTWQGLDPSENRRIGIEYGINFKNSSTIWTGCWITPTTPNGSAHVAANFKMHQDIVTGYQEGGFSAMIKKGATVKINNPKIVINPMS